MNQDFTQIISFILHEKLFYLFISYYLQCEVDDVGGFKKTSNNLTKLLHFRTKKEKNKKRIRI